jgi:hypothetical protein
MRTYPKPVRTLPRYRLAREDGGSHPAKVNRRAEWSREASRITATGGIAELPLIDGTPVRVLERSRA